MMLTRFSFPPTLDGEVDRFFRDLWRPKTAPAWEPAVDVREEADRIVLRADLPGVRPEDVKLTWENGLLTLAGERPRQAESDTTVAYHLAERRHGAFERRFQLPKDANGDAIEAAYEHGVLTISIPKRPEIKPRAIEIKAK